MNVTPDTNFRIRSDRNWRAAEAKAYHAKKRALVCSNSPMIPRRNIVGGFPFLD
jgi:hypothetical protein